MSETEKWSMVIKPKQSLLQIDFNEIWQYRDLILLLIRRDFVSRYKQTVLGPLWFIIQPLMTTIMFTIVFGRIAEIPTDGLPHLVFYMGGIVVWSYFADCLQSTSNTFVANAHIFGKVYFPRLVIPLSVVISNLIKFGIQFLFFLLFVGYYYTQGASITMNPEILVFPLLLILLAGLGLGFGIVISSLTTKYRDLTNLVGFGVQLWMYASPIIYPLSEIPAQWRIYVLANPVSPIVEAFRYGFLGTGTFSWGHLAYSFSFMVILLLIGVVLFNRTERNFIDTV